MDLTKHIRAARPSQLAGGLAQAQAAIGAIATELQLAQWELDRAVLAGDPAAIRKARAAVTAAEADRHRAEVAHSAILTRVLALDALDTLISAA